MSVEPHPCPESGLWRVGSPVVAALLAVAVFAAMLGLSAGPVLIATVVVAVVLQIVLMVGRGVYLWRSARLADLPVRWHQFLFLWSMYAGGTYLLAGEDSTSSAVIYVGSGLVFALFMLGVFWLLNRFLTR